MFRGRLIAAESRQPLSDVDITTVGAEALKGTTNLAPIVSDAQDDDGSFEVQRTLDAPRDLRIMFHSPGRVPMWREYRRLRAGVVIDFGEVAMVRGVTARIRVVDHRDAPVAGLQMKVSGELQHLDEFSIAHSFELHPDGFDGSLHIALEHHAHFLDHAGVNLVGERVERDGGLLRQLLLTFGVAELLGNLLSLL